jgi:hypothetical protein
MTDEGKIFKDTITASLREKGSQLQKSLQEALSKGGPISDAKCKQWIDDLVDNLDTFVEVLPKK